MTQRLMLAVLIVASVLTWWFWGRTLEPVRVIRQQLDAIKQAEYDVAYAHLAPDARREVPPDEFQSLVRNNGVVGQAWDSTFLTRRIQNDTATIKGHIIGRDGEAHPVGYTLIKQDGTWKIRTFRW